MARIHSLHIENFRGIKTFDQVFQMKPFICLIGRGDSGKTTILKAISCVLCPTWNISISDLDFYNADVSQGIVIEAVVGDLPVELTNLQKYGQHINLCLLVKTGVEIPVIHRLTASYMRSKFFRAI